jgi:hypothetical protein
MKLTIFLTLGIFCSCFTVYLENQKTFFLKKNELAKLLCQKDVAGSLTFETDFLDSPQGRNIGINTMLLKAFESLVASSSPAKKTKSTPNGAILTFIVCFLKVNCSTKPLLLVSIESNLPHIVMPIGQNHASSPFSLLLAYDTCAACNIGYLGHHLPITEKFPELVKSLIYAGDKYGPLTLSGIVTKNKEDGVSSMKPTAHLPPKI